MRILLWSQYFWPEAFRVNDLAASLVACEQSVTVLTGKPNYPEGRFFPGYRMMGIRRENYRGADVVRLPLLRRGMGSAIRLALNYLSFIGSGYVLAPFALRGRSYDILFVYGLSPLLQALPAIFFARLRKIPTVIWVQDLWPESLVATRYIRNPILLWIIRTLVRYIYSRADMILIQAESFRAPIARLTQDTEKIHFFPNSADAADDAVEFSREAIALADEIRDGFSIVFTGNVGRAQSMDTVVAAAEQLRNVHGLSFYIIGNGSNVAWLKAEIDRLGLTNIVLRGRLPSTDMPLIHKSASILLAALGDDPVGEYTIPSKLQSYLAAGRPIIASMNGEGARIVTEANAGIACPAKDPQALVNAVLELRQMSEDDRIGLGENGKKYYHDNFDLQHLTRKLIAHFDVLSKRKRNHSL